MFMVAPQGAPMNVHAVPCLSDNYAWILEDDDASSPGGAIVVDPSEAAPVEAALAARGLTLRAIWATHHHPDHVGGIAELVAGRSGLEVVGSRHDVERRRVPCATRAVGEGDVLTCGGQRFHVWEIPAHTLGHVAYVGDDLVFTGDTLFGGGCGRLFEGTAAGMVAALARLRALPDATRVYCGHEYTRHNLRFARDVEPESAPIAARTAALGLAGATVPTRLGDEKATNPFLRWDAPAVRDAARRRVPDADAPADVLGAIRRWKDGWKDPLKAT